MATLELRGDESDVFTAHQGRLLRVLRRRVSGPEALIEDAVSITWMTFLRVQPRRDPELFGWLVRVAEREALRLHRGVAVLTSVDHVEPAAHDDVAATAEARARLREAALAMTERQREMIGLQAAGFRYDEIAEMTAATPRTVERQIDRGRRRAHSVA